MRNDLAMKLDCLKIFNFALREIAPNINTLLAETKIEKSSIDYFVFHQANSYINGFLAKKLKLPEAKIPSTIEKFGNTSSVSIPLTIISELKNQLSDHRRLLLSGFGVGLSWGTAIIDIEDCYIGQIVEV